MNKKEIFMLSPIRTAGPPRRKTHNAWAQWPIHKSKQLIGLANRRGVNMSKLLSIARMALFEIATVTATIKTPRR